MSPKLNLTRRVPSSTHSESSNTQAASPRPPPSNYNRRESSPPTPIPRFHNKPRDEDYYQSCAPVKEEKKIAEVDDDGRGGIHSMSYPSNADTTSSSEFNVQSKDRQEISRRTMHCSDSEHDRQQQQRRGSNDGIGMGGDQKERRPRSNRLHDNFRLTLDGDDENGGGDATMTDGYNDDDGDDDDNSGRGLQVDDIAMSPIPFDHEDPATLMELPDNILTMPISPCGPHDDPVTSK